LLYPASLMVKDEWPWRFSALPFGDNYHAPALLVTPEAARRLTSGFCRETAGKPNVI